MRILFLCDKYYHDQKVPRTRFHAIEALGEIADVWCSGNGFPDWDSGKPVYDNCWSHGTVPDWIIVYKPEAYKGWGDPRLPPVATQFNDAWDTDQRYRDIMLPHAKLVIMHHANEVAAWQRRCPDVRFENIPYPINPDVFKDYKQPKTIDVLLTGAIDADIYPLRAKMARLIKQGAFGPELNVVHKKHCGYRLADPEKEAVEYAKLINSAKICLADTSKYLYAAEKYHEIPACNTAICGNLPGERREEFLNFLLLIPISATGQGIVESVKYHLADGRWENAAKRGHTYVHGRFTTRHYAQRLVEILRG